MVFLGFLSHAEAQRRREEEGEREGGKEGKNS